MRRQRREAAGNLIFGIKKKPSTAQPRPQIQIPENGIGPVHEINEHDVLCGRGGRVNAHTGNIRFRDIIVERRPEYLDPRLKKLDKAWVAADIVRKIRIDGGRFLKMASDGAWWDIGDAKAIKKVGQALREDANDVRDELVKTQEEQPRVILEVGVGDPTHTYEQAVLSPPNQALFKAGQQSPLIETAFGQVFHPTEVHTETATSMISGLSEPTLLSNFSGISRQISHMNSNQLGVGNSANTLTPMDLASLPSLPVTAANERTSTLSSLPSLNTSSLNELTAAQMLEMSGLADRQAMPAPARVVRRHPPGMALVACDNMSWADNSLMGGGIEIDPQPHHPYSSNMSVATKSIMSIEDGASQISAGMMSLDLTDNRNRKTLY